MTQPIKATPTWCPDCGLAGDYRRCHDCGRFAYIIDCGHQPQPPLISAGREDGSDMDHWYCEDCGARPARDPRAEAEAIKAIYAAREPGQLRAAVLCACAQHRMTTEPDGWPDEVLYPALSMTATGRGLSDLARALDYALDRAEGWDSVPPHAERRCICCDRIIDPHAPTHVVSCGQCGAVE